MLSTKNVNANGQSGVSKTLSPGNVIAKINSVVLEDFKFKDGAKHLMLSLEGVDLGESFEGFMIDKDNPSEGRYKGQIARVRHNEYAYADGETRFGPIKRDDEILRAVKNLCVAMNLEKWFEAQDEKHATIEDFVEAFNREKPFEGIFMEFCLAGREYQNKSGYTSYDMFLPKFSKGMVPYEILDKESGKLIQFNPETHIKRSESKSVDGFGGDDEQSVSQTNSDFDL